MIESETVTQPIPSKARRQRHIEMFWICGVALVLAFMMEVGEAGTVHFRFLPSLPLPQTCFSRQVFGVDCPGCGLTRSYIYFAAGNWEQSWSMHRVGWLMFLLTVVQIPYRWMAIRNPNREVIPLTAARRIGTALITLLVGNWLYGIVFLQIPNCN